MTDFKVGDKVRAAEIYVQESEAWVVESGVGLDSTGERLVRTGTDRGLDMSRAMA